MVFNTKAKITRTKDRHVCIQEESVLKWVVYETVVFRKLYVLVPNKVECRQLYTHKSNASCIISSENIRVCIVFVFVIVNLFIPIQNMMKEPSIGMCLKGFVFILTVPTVKG